jgi:hypothetical protein
MIRSLKNGGLMEKEKEKKKWHKHTIICPKCSKPIVVKSFAFTSSGDIRIMEIMASCAMSEKEGRKVMLEKTVKGSNERVN